MDIEQQELLRQIRIKHPLRPGEDRTAWLSMTRGEAVLQRNWKQQQKQADCKPVPSASVVGQPQTGTLLGRISLNPRPRNRFTDLVMQLRKVGGS